MSFAERIRHGAEGFESSMKSGKFDSIIKNQSLNAALNSGLKSADKSRLVKGIANAHSGHGKPNYQI